MHQLGLERLDQGGELAPPQEPEPSVEHVGVEPHAGRRQPVVMDRAARDDGNLLHAGRVQACHHVGGVRLGATIGAARHDLQDAHTQA